MVAVVCLGMFLGVVAAPTFSASWITGSVWLLVGITLVLSACIYQRAAWVLAALLGGVVIGLWRGTVTDETYAAYDPLVGKTIVLQGTVSEDIASDKKGSITLRLKNIYYQEKALHGLVWVSLGAKSADIQRSDTVTISGKTTDGFGTFAASIYRGTLIKVERPKPGDVALHVRDWFATAIRRAIPEPEASLGVGYLVGQRRNLPVELDTALKIAGLTHIVVASGYNLTILVRLSRRLFSKVSKYLAALTSSALIFSFILVTGLSPSMSRAGFVAGLSLLAWYYGRKFHPIILLLLAIAVTVLINPSYAWGDVGWQLSFAAFAGVMLLAPLLQAFYFGDTKAGIIRQILGETIAATIMTLPILLLTFGYISNVAIFANLLILPLVPLAMLLTSIGGIGALLFPLAAEIIGFPAQLVLSYMTQTAYYFAGLPWAKSDVTITPIVAGGMYACIASFMVFMWWRSKLNLRDANLVV